MNKLFKFLSLIPLLGVISSVAYSSNDENILVANAVNAISYDSDASKESDYSNQNDLTFKYIHLGSTLNNYRGDSVKVGIIDSGINYSHEDFDNALINENSRSYQYSSTDNKWYYYTYKNKPSNILDTFGHGSNVASVIASSINSLGEVGISPNVDLYIFKVTNSNNSYEIGAIQSALYDAAELKLDVLNMSISCYENAVSYQTSYQGASSNCKSLLQTYVDKAYKAGVTLVAASGNHNTSEPSYPASNDHVISVGSLAKNSYDEKADYSNYGSYVDLVAPGYVNVASHSGNNLYRSQSGTSFSAPLVTGAIALYKQKNPSSTPSEIEEALYASCDAIDDDSSPYTNWAGHGALNVEKFLGIDESTFSSITPSETSLSLYKNSTHQISLKATHSDGNITNQIIDDRYSFIVSNPDILDVTSTGLIKVKTSGTTKITVNGPNNTSCEIDVDVSSIDIPVTGISIDNKFSNVYIEDSSIAKSLTYSISPSNATNTRVSFTSSDEDVISIDEDGKLKYKKYGETTITVTTEDGGFSDSFVARVFDIVTDYNNEILSLTDNETFALNARFEPVNTDSYFLYESGDEDFAPIDMDSGVITFNGSGAFIFTIIGEIEIDGSTLKAEKYLYIYVDDGNSNEYALNWSTTFLENISCNLEGRTPPSIDGWNSSKTAYIALDEVSQYLIANYTALEDESDVIALAVYKYDYVLSKYNKNSIVYNEFITGRDKSNTISPVYNASSFDEIIIILFSGLIVFTTGISLIIIRKKHRYENH